MTERPVTAPDPASEPSAWAVLRTIRAQSSIVFVTLVTMAVAAGLLGRYSYLETVGALEAAQDRQSTLLHLSRIAEHLAAMQAAQRGFVITGDPGEIDRYARESSQFDRELQAAFEGLSDPQSRTSLARARDRARSWRSVAERVLAQRRAGKDVRDLVAREGAPRFAAAWAAFSEVELAGADHSARAAEESRRHIENATIAITATASVGALIILGLLWATSRKVVEPLATLAASARLLAKGNATAELPARRNDEIGTLIDAFADMRAAVQERIEAARAANAQLLAILDTVPAGIVLLDRAGNMRLQNRMAAQFLGSPPADEADRLSYWKSFSLWDGAGNPLRIRELAPVRALSGEFVHGQKIAVRRPDGARVDLLVAAAPILMDQGDVAGAVTGFQDVTALRELDRLKDEFVALASHQLRTPATAVKGNLGLLLEGYCGDLTPEQLEVVRDAFESNERQLRIIEDILWVARTDAGRLSIVKAPTDVAALVDAVVDELRPAVAARRQTLDVVHAAAPAPADLDAGKVRMVVENLLSNASKYTPEGGSVAVESDVTPATVVITVRDTGVGIAEQDQDRLFGKFARIDNPLSTQVGGSGLGLYLVNEIVRLHGGAIRVVSRVGHGSSFTVTLPRR